MYIELWDSDSCARGWGRGGLRRSAVWFFARARARMCARMCARGCARFIPWLRVRVRAFIFVRRSASAVCGLAYA